MSTGAFQTGELERPERKRRHPALAALYSSRDAGWEEQKHPRGKGGQFASAGGGVHAAQKLKLSDFDKVGEQLGSNPGGVYKHKQTGEKFYIKHSKSNDHAKNEHLASKLYELVGSPVLQHHLVDLGNDKLGTATKWQEGGVQINPNSPNHLEAAREHFATHAWTANWDAIGLGNDNQAMFDGMMHTLDLGGSLNYRAQGAPKGEAFSHSATDWDTLRNHVKNAKSAAVFKGMNSAELRNSAIKIALANNNTIEMLTMLYGPGSEADRQALSKKLIARKHDLITRVMKE